MSSRHRWLALTAIVAMVAAGCQATAPVASPLPSPAARPSRFTSASGEPTSPASPGADVPPGTIAFNRVADDGVEHYFTIRTDGTSEERLFSAEGCTCLRWSPDGSEIWTLSQTEGGTIAFTTMNPDGSDRTVHEPPSETLSLAPGAGTADGRLVAFNGWDETTPSNSGLYVGSPRLEELRQVTALPDGVTSVEPFGMTPDGNRILFFGERGSVGDVTHTGDLFIVDVDGTNLRQLNADSLSLSLVNGLPASLSPDGQQAAFAAFEGEPSSSAVYVVSVAGGDAERLTDVTGGVWSAAWSPVGQQIAFAKWWNDGSILSVMNADGTNRKRLSGTRPVGFGAWSPDGTHLVVGPEPQTKGDLWIVDLEGHFVSQVTHQPSNYGIYAWGPGTGD